MVHSKNIQLVVTSIVLSVDEFGRRLYGPFEEHAIGGNNIVLFVDDFGRRLCGPFKEHTIGGNNIV